MEDRELGRELRLAIKRELDKCSSSITPKFCQMMQSRNGYLKAESMIIDYCIKNQVSVSAAIGQLEVELE